MEKIIKSNDLLKVYRESNVEHTSYKLVFSGVEGYDVYNISAPFEIDQKKYIAGRVEKRNSEYSKVMFFEKKTSTEWNLSADAIQFNLQDPFITKLDEMTLIGGVDVEFDAKTDKPLRWRTKFFKMNSISDMEELFAGPWGMKDLRLGQLSDGRIAVLTRPQGEKGGLGRIGFTVIKHLNELTIELVEEAPLLSNLFPNSEWIGSNEVFERNGKIQVLSHIGSKDEDGNLHYRAMMFDVDQEQTALVNPRIIAERKDFLDGPKKRPDLGDVVFSGGLEINSDETINFYAGTSDAEAQFMTIPNPFN